MQKELFLLVVILLLASVLRLWGLNDAPSGFNADEASLGYNAYSILNTGKDEYGDVLPLVFKSFGDYKPGLYVYIVLPFVALLGLGELAVRIPSALLAVATVYVTFLLADKLMSRKIALVAALLLAISPWHIHFSRGGWESNGATFFITLGVYLFVKYRQSPAPRYFLGSNLAFLGAMYIYQSPRLVVPLLLTILYLPLLGRLKKSYRNYIWPSIGLFLVGLPFVWQLIAGTGISRFNGLSFFTDQGPVSRVEQLRGEHLNQDNWSSKLIHNKLTAYTPELFRHYLDHFSPDFLFINGDQVERNKVPETGQLYLIESLMLLVGLYYLIRQTRSNNSIILIWLLVAPAAAALTYQTPSALRSLNMVVPLTIICALGAVKILEWFQKKAIKISLIAVIVLCFSFEISHYLESYYIHYPKRYPSAWEYGFKEMVTKMEKYEDQYSKIVISDRLDQPYILVLFYKKYDPRKYQPQALLTNRDQFNFGTVKGFDKYEFHSFTKEDIEASHNILYIGTPKDVQEPSNMIDEVKFPNEQRAFFFSKT